MIEAWRIVRKKWLPTASTGEGAAKWGGRWNERGTRMVYTSAHESLAAMELLVHINPASPRTYWSIRYTFDERLVERIDIDKLPDDWCAEPPADSTKRLGTDWTREARSAVLAVPSAIIQRESNYLLNPLHRDFPLIVADREVEFVVDQRLINGG